METQKGPQNHLFEFVAPLSGPAIMKREIEFALRKTKLNKAMGPDEINTEMIKTLEDMGIDTLHKLFNKLYETGEIPSDMAKSIIITLPKKPGAKICDEYRTYSLMSHTVKLLLGLIMQRIRKLHPEINECQFGFMPDKGTPNAVFTLKNLGQRAIEMKKDLFLCFIDYKKAFDQVKHNEMICMLDQIGIDDKDFRIIQNLYYEQTASVKINDKVGDFTPIQRGVRQGCVLSPDLFSLYSEIILRHIEREGGIKIGGHNINHLRYADDTVLLAASEEKLQNLIQIVNRKSMIYEMELNAKKTETMVVTKKQETNIPTCNLTVNGLSLRQVNKFKYLGTRT